MARYSNGDQFEIAHLKRKCKICGRYMPPVGRARRAVGLEGRNHDDWRTSVSQEVLEKACTQVRILTLDDKYM